jgi:TetR/AcrR family fatty acid metabolism transcriptional regulator
MWARDSGDGVRPDLEVGTVAARRPQEERRRQILEAAAEVFARRGYYEAKVEEVAFRAGIGKGTVYEYFRSKRELFQAMLDHVGEYHLQVLKASLESAHSSQEKLGAVARAHLELLLEHRALARLAFYSPVILGPEIWSWVERQERALVALFSKIFREGLERGELRPVDEQVAARAFMGVLWSAGGSLICRPGALPGRPHPAEMAMTLVDLLWRGLARRR